MKSDRTNLWRLTVLLALLGAGILGGYVLRGVAGPAPSAAAAQGSAGALPKDVDPVSGFRLPLLKRDDLDDEGKKVYDTVANPSSPGVAGLRGPDGVLLYNPHLSILNRDLNQYLRYGAGLKGSIRELAILTVARELNSQLEWTTHEPNARKEGLDPKIIDVVKYRKSTQGLPEEEASVIQMGRELFGQRALTSKTYARALKAFGPKPLVNIVFLMGNYCQTATLIKAFDVHMREGTKLLLPMP